VEHGVIILPKPGRLHGTTRIALVADLKLREEHLRAVSLHTSTMLLSRRLRLRQVEAVLDSLAELPGPTIMGGDFNTVRDKDIRSPLEVSRRGGFMRAPTAGEATAKSFWLGLMGSPRELDHIFTRGLTCRRAGVRAQSTASDHRPVWAVFSWPPERREAEP
jgi:endonuclease/exonuclease/phosphatase (EEP) superfamily protein YafD